MRFLIVTCLLVSPFAIADAPKADESDKDATLYSAFGKRDPFRTPDRTGLTKGGFNLDPVRKYRLEAYRLRAILRIGGKPQAMFEDPDGKSHVVREGDRMGMEGARVSRIVNSEVIVTERSANYLGQETLLEKVISLPASEAPVDTGAGEVVQQGGFSRRDTSSDDGANKNAAGPGPAVPQVSSSEPQPVAEPAAGPGPKSTSIPMGVSK